MFRWNITSGYAENYVGQEIQYLVPIGDFAVMTVLAVFSTLFLMLFAMSTIELRRMLDRYRLKYGFDRELEGKDMKEPKDYKLNKREGYFKKRTFKD